MSDVKVDLSAAKSVFSWVCSQVQGQASMDGDDETAAYIAQCVRFYEAWRNTVDMLVNAGGGLERIVENERLRQAYEAREAEFAAYRCPFCKEADYWLCMCPGVRPDSIGLRALRNAINGNNEEDEG